MNTETSIHRAHLTKIALLAATFATMALVVSTHTQADQPAAAKAPVTTQSAQPMPLETQSLTETPVSMTYHDNINVAAISVAAYDR